METFQTVISSPITWSIIGAIVLIIVLIKCWIQAPPSTAYILSGLRKKPRVLVGTGGFKVPVIERMDTTFLGQVSVDVKTSVPVPTKDFIDVIVDAECKVRVVPTDEGMRLASKNFLNMPDTKIAASIKPTLEGNMREVIGAINLRELVTDRDTFSDQIQQKAAKDMAALGLEILSCNIQNITDQNGLIQGMGADNTYKIKKDAAITKANAEKDMEIAEAEAKKAANDARVQAETEIAVRNNELAIKKADLKRESDTKQAEADAAYEIQKQEQLKLINEKSVEAEIIKTKKEQSLADERVKVIQNEYRGSVNAKADAELYKTQKESDASKYQVEIKAKADLEQRKREAEARTYEAEKEAEAMRAKADADRYFKEQEAAGIKAKAEAEAFNIQQCGLAEAEAIKSKGMAEAEAMEKKAEAYQKYGQAAIVEILANIMPEMAKNVAAPLGSIKDLTIYGGDPSAVSANVPVAIKQTMDVIQNVTGVNMTEVIEAQTNVNRTHTINGDVIKGSKK